MTGLRKTPIPMVSGRLLTGFGQRHLQHGKAFGCSDGVQLNPRVHARCVVIAECLGMGIEVELQICVACRALNCREVSCIRGRTELPACHRACLGKRYRGSGQPEGNKMSGRRRYGTATEARLRSNIQKPD